MGTLQYKTQKYSMYKVLKRANPHIRETEIIKIPLLNESNIY